MRKSLRLAFVSAALGAISIASTAQAQAATVATANVSAEVLSTLAITADSALSFGQIAANGGGSVTVNSDATVAATGTLISTGTRAPATFSVTGTPLTNVFVSLPRSASLVRTGGTETMTITAFNTNRTGPFQLAATTGRATFSVGGTLAVTASQPAGIYRGTFTVAVEYQ